MHYFIDGYNLMFRVLRAEGDLQKQRETIIEDLETKINALQLDVTLVFDAQYQSEEASRSHKLGLEILFTNARETADDFILQALKEETKPHRQTVVTSDKQLARLARRHHARTETVEEFISWLNRRYKNSQRLKRSTKATPNPITLKKNSIPNPISVASPPEECFDFYLNVFQQSFLALNEESITKKNTRKSKKHLTTKKTHSPKNSAAIIESEHSILQRWLHAFHRNVDDAC